MDNMPFAEPLVPIVAGLVGGFVRCFVFDNKDCWPNKKIDKNFASNLVVGCVSGFVVWCLGIQELEWKRQIAFCVLAGIGGPAVLSGYVKKIFGPKAEDNLKGAEEIKQLTDYLYKTVVDINREITEDNDLDENSKRVARSQLIIDPLLQLIRRFTLTNFNNTNVR